MEHTIHEILNRLENKLDTGLADLNKKIDSFTYKSIVECSSLDKRVALTENDIEVLKKDKKAVIDIIMKIVIAAVLILLGFKESLLKVFAN